MFKRYKPFFRAGAMDCLAYKSSMFGWVIVSVLEVLSVFFMWIGVYKSSADGVNSVINGFTFHEMLVYVTFVNVFNFVSLNGDQCILSLTTSTRAQLQCPSSNPFPTACVLPSPTWATLS